MKSKLLWTAMAGLAASATLVLGGCGVSTPDATVQQSPPVNTDMSAPPAPPADSSEETAPTSPDQKLNYQDPVLAAGIALEAHPGSHVREIFLDRVRGATVWQVEMASQHGRQEVSVDASNGEIVWDYCERCGQDGNHRQHSAHKRHGHHGNRDNYRGDAATSGEQSPRPQVDYRAAINTAFKAVPGGTLVELKLVEEDGQPAWEAELISADHVEYELLIDAATGEVLQIEVDD